MILIEAYPFTCISDSIKSSSISHTLVWIFFFLSVHLLNVQNTEPHTSADTNWPNSTEFNRLQ